jgi:hypothetical protein
MARSPTPRAPPEGRTILTTFAGRRDRMALLNRYARAALARGIIDEWHVWDFARNEDDRRWLREEFPSLRMTPGDGVAYFSTQASLRLDAGAAVLRCAVAATNDVHIGLRRLSGTGPSYEIVLGGWGNNACAIRAFDDPHLLEAPERRGGEFNVRTADTPGLLPEWGFADIALTLRPDGLSASVGGRVAVAHDAPVPAGEFAVLVRSGFGADAEWRFEGGPARGAYLFRSAPTYPFYLPFYRHYARHLPDYAGDVFLKCDDDIVFVDLDGLRRFIAFRRANPHYFMLSANVVNNGVCAFFQQQRGVFPSGLLELEMPPNGFCGSLWDSGRKAEILHDRFLQDPARFQETVPEITEWNARQSINFIALLGADFVHIPDLMEDDEDFLSYRGRVRSRRPNAIYNPFTVAHLTFFPQERDFDHARILAGYAALAARHGVD